MKTKVFWKSQEIIRNLSPSRPIPTAGILPPVFCNDIPPGARRVATFYYLGTFPLPRHNLPPNDFCHACDSLVFNLMDSEPEIYSPLTLNATKNVDDEYPSFPSAIAHANLPNFIVPYVVSLGFF